MRRITPRMTAARVGASFSRAIVEQTDDDKKWQEVQFGLQHDETASDVEQVHPYGFTARPKSPTTEGGKKRHAEALVIFPSGGDRSHGVAVVTGDRRYRLKSLQEGEVALHDDQGQKVHLTRDGILMEAPKKITLKVGNSTLVITETGITLTSSEIDHKQS